MRIYSASSEENLRARRLLKDWAGEGFLTEEQYQRMEKETAFDLRTTNIFLRLILFFFSLIIVCAAVGLFYLVFLSRPSAQTTGVFLFIFAAVSYAVAEAAASQSRLYRYGIEEALAVCSVGFLCVGVLMAFSSGTAYSPRLGGTEPLALAVAAIFSVWIWHRFGLWYAFPAAMIFVAFLPGYWTSSHSWQHVIVVVFYAAGLACVAAIRSRHRFDYLDTSYSLDEALLWLGIYLAINLQLSSLNLLPIWRGGAIADASEFSGPFYWATWALTWCVPPIVLVRGIRHKDRFVIAVGAVVAVLTLVTNKPYLGWERHTWDPMLLGVLLTGVALFIRRWLARGPQGVRRGFTAERLSGRDKQWMSAGSTAIGLFAPSVLPAPQTSNPEVRFGGGDSGGGGASSDF